MIKSIYQTKRMNRKIKLLTLIMITAYLIGGCASNEEEKTGKQVKDYKKVTVVSVKPETIRQNITITGVVRPLQTLEVVAQVQGIALGTQPSFREGIRFKKGQLLVHIDDSEFRNSLIAQKSQFVSSLVRIMSDLKIDYPSSFPVWETYLDHIDLARPLPELPEVTDKKLGYFLSANGIINTYYSIISQEKQLSKYRIYAPYDGVVTSDHFNRGSLIRPGVSLGKYNFTDTYEIVASVSVKDLANLQQAEEVVFQSKATGQQWSCALSRISEKVDASTQAVNVFFLARGAGLKEGMYLEAHLKLKAFDDAVQIPTSLITRSNQVFILKDSLIQLKSVEPLAYNSSSVIVKGLQAGDLLINEKIKSTLQGIKAISK